MTEEPKKSRAAEYPTVVELREMAESAKTFELEHLDSDKLVALLEKGANDLEKAIELGFQLTDKLLELSLISVMRSMIQQPERPQVRVLQLDEGVYTDFCREQLRRDQPERQRDLKKAAVRAALESVGVRKVVELRGGDQVTAHIKAVSETLPGWTDDLAKFLEKGGTP